MTVTLIIPTLCCFGRLADCVWSALAGTVRPDRVIVIDNSAGQCPPIPGAEIVLGRQPQAVAKAWNDGISLAGSSSQIVVSNDDIVFAPDTIERLLAIAESTPRAGIVSVLEGARFACFWLRWAAYMDVGPFDEAFCGAYFEDNDYAYRLHLAGWKLPVAPSNIQHVGSATIAAMTNTQMDAKHLNYAANQERFFRKWGGPPHAETYHEPFGGEA